jgi:hypothetical protein
MNETINYNPSNISSRWLGYFDLLGTSKLIQSGKIVEVFLAYQEALEKLKSWEKSNPNVSTAWFSDTFIIFSEDDSGLSFQAIDLISRWLMFSLLRRSIPVRGAISCGSFYADNSNRIYLGQALLEAYEWGENQDWIGMLLCPSSIIRLDELNLPIKERLNYTFCEVPFKKPHQDGPLNFAACILGQWVRSSSDQNILLEYIRKLSVTQKEEPVRLKYERTIQFIEKYDRKSANNGIQADATEPRR